MDIEEIKRILGRYNTLLDEGINKIEQLQRKAAGLNFPEGEKMGDTLIRIHQVEQQKIDDAVNWLDAVKLTPRSEF